MTAGATVGGEAGSGARSGNVTIVNTGSLINTVNNSSAGIFAQSVGGSGGSGGSALNASLNGGGTAAVTLGANIGGKGGSGGSAGDVSITNSASINTELVMEALTGNYSYGIYAQSVSGGGGQAELDAGFNFWGRKSCGWRSIQGRRIGKALVMLKLEIPANVTTKGDFTTGILAQSIGGGGGAGRNTLSLTGSGGSNAVGTGVNLGGSGAVGGTAGDVTVSNTAAITTGTNALHQLYGNNSYGIYAQSVGGGGAGGKAISGSVTVSKEPMPMSASLGGSGGSGSTGGDVSVTNGGVIRTLGNNSAAVYAQSLGGGGGSGGRVINAQLAGSTGGAAVNAGASVEATAARVATPAMSPFRQRQMPPLCCSMVIIRRFRLRTLCSICRWWRCAGGHGAGQLGGSSKTAVNAGVSIGGNGTAGGAAGNDCHQHSCINSHAGDHASGIVAQSIGGGGGSGGNALNIRATGSTGKSVTLGGSVSPVAAAVLAAVQATSPLPPAAIFKPVLLMRTVLFLVVILLTACLPNPSAVVELVEQSSQPLSRRSYLSGANIAGSGGGGGGRALMSLFRHHYHRG